MSSQLGRAESLSVTVPQTESRGYPVVVGQGVLRDLGRLVAEAVPAHKYALIADSRVAELHANTVVDSLEAAGCDTQLLTFPAGEWNKSRAAWATLSDELLECGFGRDSAIVTLGGGVAGDLGGFVASTYMRGIPFVTIPTSLLAMVDASLGGKTGIDLELGKNAIGTFHHPSLVLVDPDFLVSLPRPHLRAGLAEAIKTAAIMDEALFESIESLAPRLAEGDASALTDLIRACVQIKAQVVSQDPEESGLRQILNFGHTSGHALETLAGLALLHGEAVAAGMRLDSRLGEAIGVTDPGTADRLDAALDACRVPNVIDGTVTAGRLLQAAAADKKNREGKLRWVFLRRIGEVATDESGAYSFAVDEAEALEYMEAALRTAAEDADS
jgi:3-dehydroquinate synthase